MKLVILAAGKGKRMGESSNHTPKPLLTYKGKTLTHHKLDALSDAFDEIIFVVGHLGEKFEDILGREYTLSSGKKVPLTYVWQKELLGTAHALHQAKEVIGNSPFVVLMGDDLYSGEDIDKMIQHYNASGQWSVLLENSQTPMSAGKCLVNNLGNLIDIVEDPEATIPINKMYTGGCLLTPEIFNSKRHNIQKRRLLKRPLKLLFARSNTRGKEYGTQYLLCLWSFNASVDTNNIFNMREVTFE